MIDKAVLDVLLADGALSALLAEHNGAPAVFVHNNVPADFARGDLPYVALSDAVTGPYLDGDRRTFSADVDVLVLCRDMGDAGPVETAAAAVKAALDGVDVAPADHAAGGTSVTGPTRDDPDDLTFGRRMTATVLLTEI